MVKFALASAILLLGASTSYLPQVSAINHVNRAVHSAVARQHREQDQQLLSRSLDSALLAEREVEVHGERKKRADKVCTRAKKSTTTPAKKKKKTTTTTKRKTTSTTTKKPTTTSTTKTTTSTSTAKTTTSTSTTKTTTSTSTTKTSTSTTSTSTTSTSTTKTSTSTTTSSTPTGTSAWSLVDNYQGTNFFDKWNFFNWGDPTNGNVQYLARPDAEAAGLAYLNGKGQAITKVDSANDYAYGVNRPSVRLQSKVSYSNGLVLWDIEHMPVGCAVWPALWSNGPGTWPNGGEIDLLEGVGDQAWNSVSLHTAQGCKAGPQDSSYYGTLNRGDCYAHNKPTGGCAITSGTGAAPTYGSGVNAGGGGVYAVRFDDDTGITAWFLPRSSIPADVTAGKPQPDTWPTPMARYPSSSCPFSTYFGPQTLIVTMTLCGDWAGSPGVYGNNWPGNGEGTCPGNCTGRVMTGSNFDDAYFTFNYVKIFQLK